MVAASSAARALDFPLEPLSLFGTQAGRPQAIPLWDDDVAVDGAGMFTLHDELRARGLSVRSASTYEGEIRRAQAFMAQRSTSLEAAGPDDVEAYVLTKPRSWSSYKLIRNALRHYWEIVGRRRPPLWAIPEMRRPRWQCRALEEDDAARLEAAARARGDARGLATLLGLYLGLRREEIASLRWDAFAGDGWATIVGKGGVTRFVFVHPVLDEAMAAARAIADSDVWVFPGHKGRTHVHPATVWDWVRSVSAAAGVELGATVPPHRLRHTNLAEMNDRTGDLRTTQEHAGHARPETTAMYTRTTRRRLRQAVLAIDYGGSREVVEG